MDIVDRRGKILSVGTSVRLFPTGGTGTVRSVSDIGPDHEGDVCGFVDVDLDASGGDSFPVFCDRSGARCEDLEARPAPYEIHNRRSARAASMANYCLSRSLWAGVAYR